MILIQSSTRRRLGGRRRYQRIYIMRNRNGYSRRIGGRDKKFFHLGVNIRGLVEKYSLCIYVTNIIHSKVMRHISDDRKIIDSTQTLTYIIHQKVLGTGKGNIINVSYREDKCKHRNGMSGHKTNRFKCRIKMMSNLRAACLSP